MYNHRWKALFQILHMTRDMSAKELHRKVKGKVCLSTIKNWKAGRVSSPRFDTMQAVLTSLGYTFDIVEQNEARHMFKTKSKKYMSTLELEESKVMKQLQSLIH